MYVAQKFESQGTPLLQDTLQEQAMVNQWVEVEAHNLNPPFKVLSMEY
jgi:glutathione S-transferase